jgi:hypothetical protein
MMQRNLDHCQAPALPDTGAALHRANYAAANSAAYSRGRTTGANAGARQAQGTGER